MVTKKATSKRDAGGREFIDTGTSKRSVRRGANGRFTTDQVLLGRSRKPKSTGPKRGERRPP